MIKQLKHTIL